jgi:hypothetical protein
MAVAAGDTVWILLAHIGPGEIVGAYATLALAQAAVGTRQSATYRILPVVVDTEGGSLSPASIPVRRGIRDGRPHG